MRIAEILIEKTLIDPTVNWVDQLLSTVQPTGDVYELADALTDAFYEKGIGFEVSRGSYGAGVFRAKQSAAVGLTGAEWIGKDSDPQMVIKITSKAATLPTLAGAFSNRLKELISHELVHAKQAELSKTGKIGNSKDGDAYYSDPQEINAIATEIKSQLLRIEPNASTLITMIQRGDPHLEKSDRYRLYSQSAKTDPQFRKAFNRIRTQVINLIQ